NRHMLVRLLCASTEACKVVDDCRHGVRADRAHNLLAVVRVQMDHQAGDVANEVTGLLLPEDHAVIVRQVSSSVCVRGVDATELRIREGRSNLRGVLEEVEAGAEDEPVTRLCCGLKIGETILRRLRDVDATLDAKLLLGLDDAEV